MTYGVDKEGKKVNSFVFEDTDEAFGANSPEERYTISSGEIVIHQIPVLYNVNGIMMYPTGCSMRLIKGQGMGIDYRWSDGLWPKNKTQPSYYSTSAIKYNIAASSLYSQTDSLGIHLKLPILTNHVSNDSSVSGMAKLSVTYAYFTREDMSLTTLNEFNNYEIFILNNYTGEENEIYI